MSAQNAQVTFEVALKTPLGNPGNIEILKGLLLGIGIDETAIIECEQFPHICLSIYFRSQSKARMLQKKLRAFHLRDVTIRIKSLKKKDWQTKWKREFKPLALSQSFWVVPMWLKKKHRLRNKIPIYIDTSVAFGTGMHATTRFMVQLIDRCKGKFKNFIDLGTGTGILSIIAAKCGVHDVMAVDISRASVAVAKENFKGNECSWIKTRVVNVQKLNTGKQYDFVCANIITQDLISMGGKIVSMVKPGKYLAVSGISLNSYDVFRKAYHKYPLRCLKIEKGEGWAAILYKKLEPRAK